MPESITTCSESPEGWDSTMCVAASVCTGTGGGISSSNSDLRWEGERK